MQRESPKLTVDAVIIENDSVVLIKRRNYPFEGMWALPGGFVNYGERVEDAVVREAKEETGLDVRVEKLVGVYSAPDRDPRGHTVGVAFLCKIIGGTLKFGDDAAEVKKFRISELPELAFDHRKILANALEFLKG